MNAVTDSRIFDEAGMLDRLGGSEELARKVVHIFCEDVAERRRAVEAALAVGECEMVAEAAHALKGAAGNVGGDAVYRVCLKMEMAARKGDIGTARAAGARLDEVLPALFDCLDAWLAREDAPA